MPEARVTVGDVVRVEVSDDDPRPAVLREPDRDTETGWGLNFVAEQADRWGCDPRDDGKTVWFELDRGRG